MSERDRTGRGGDQQSTIISKPSNVPPSQDPKQIEILARKKKSSGLMPSSKPTMLQMRKSKLVTVCSVDSSFSEHNVPTKYSSNSFKLRSCKSSWHIKVPINEHNIVLHEMYGDVYNKECVTCQKVNFLTLCCNSNVDIEKILLSYDEYQHVKYVEFTGHIGSMKVAFELLHKFPNVKEVIFVLNENNVKSENAEYSSFRNEDGFVTKALTVEKLTIFQDYSGCEQHSKDIQERGNIWRLDEIFFLSRLCTPNLKKFETRLIGNGKTYEKVQCFIDCMPFLKKNHSVEISGGLLTVMNNATANRMAVEIQAPTPASSTVTMCAVNTTFIPNPSMPSQPNIKPEASDDSTEASEEYSPYQNVDRYSNQTQLETQGYRPQGTLFTRYEETPVGTCQLPNTSSETLSTSSSDSNSLRNISAQPAAQQSSIPGPSSMLTSNAHSLSLGMRNNAESTLQKDRHPGTTPGTAGSLENGSRRVGTRFSSNLDDDVRLLTSRNPSPPTSAPSLPAPSAAPRIDGRPLVVDPRLENLEVQRNATNSAWKAPASSTNDWNNLVHNFLCDPRIAQGETRERQSHSRRSVSRSRSRSRSHSSNHNQRGGSPESSWRSQRSRSPRHRMSDRGRESHAFQYEGHDRPYRQTYPDNGDHYDEHYNRSRSNFRSRARGRGRGRGRRPRRGRNSVS